MTDGHVVRTFMWHAARIWERISVGQPRGRRLLVGAIDWRVILWIRGILRGCGARFGGCPRIATMELLAFGLCVGAMLLPSLWSTRIRPALSLRMQ